MENRVNHPDYYNSHPSGIELGHKLYVGDLIVCCCYGNTAKLYLLKKIFNIRILAVREDNKTWDNYLNPDRVIKVNKNGIPKS